MPWLKETVRKFLPRTRKRHVILRGPLRGANIVTSWHDYPGAILGRTERHLLGWFETHVARGETWIDVGAHYGYTAIALCRLVGPAGRVIAFEPVLSSAGCLNLTRQKNDFRQLTVVPFGLSASPTLTPVRLPTVRGMADATIHGAAPEESILTIAFDNVWPSLCDGTRDIHGVKIDVQGMEAEVLTGMREMLVRHRPKVVVEFHSGVQRTSVLDCFEQCGYNLAGEPIHPRDRNGVQRYEDDQSYYFRPL